MTHIKKKILLKVLVAGTIIVFSNATAFSEEVTIKTDKIKYKSKISTDEYYVRGETINISIINNLEKDIYFDSKFIIPFTSIYIEAYRQGVWQIYDEMHSEDEYPKNFTFQKWLESATQLNPKQKISVQKEIIHSFVFGLFKGKCRLKLEYFSMPEESTVNYSEVDFTEYRKKANFKTVYSNVFRIK